MDHGHYTNGIMLSEIDNALIISLINKNQFENNSLSLSDTTLHSNSTNDIMPIKFVDNSLYKTMKNIAKGVGTCSTIVAVPQLLKNCQQTAKLVWRVLLYSGSNGHLLFVHCSTKDKIPQKERFAPQMDNF